MKNYTYPFCALILALFTGTISLKAQTTFNGNWEIGLGVGYTTYYGDLSNYRINKFSNIFKVLNYNKYYSRQPSVSVLFQTKLTPTLGLMLQGNVLQFGMSDRYRKNNGSINTAALHYSRSLNFRTNLQDIGLAFTFNLNNGAIFPANAFFYPSFFIGAGVSRFSVRGDLYDENGNPYNYLLPGNINDNNYESNLRDFRTETANRFRNVEPYIDLGLALNFRVNDVLTIALQSDIKYSASDYLDDVSSKYKASYATPAERYAARPGYNVINPVTLQRGDDDSRNDFYVNNRVVLRINLLKEKKEKPFSPPVIYSTNIPYYRQKALNAASHAAKLDSVQHAENDSLKSQKTDSLQIADSTNRLASTSLADSTIQRQLQNINTELKDIKALLVERGLAPRELRLQYQADSIKLRRNNILLQGVVGREDSLRVRVFDLQIDSLRYEWERSQPGLQGSGSIINRIPATVPDAFEKNIEPRLSQANIRSALSETNAGLLNAEMISIMKRDERYRTNAAYRSEVDRLELRSRTYLKPGTVNNNNQSRIDSLQLILDALELRTLRDSSSIDPAVRQRLQDSVTYDEQLRKYNQRKQQQRADSIYSYQRQLQRYNDSAIHYGRQTNKVDVLQTDTLQTNRKWYQRLFGRRKNRERVTNEPVPEEYATRRQYYESEAAVVNRRLERMRRDSASAIAATSLNNVSYEQQAGDINLMLQRNTDSLQRLQGQIHRSNDSAFYYSTLAQKDQDETAALEKERKWYNSIFTSRKKERERAEKQISVRNQALEQQRIYDEEVNRMRTRMNEMEARNRELSRDYQSLNSSRESINRYNNRQVVPQVIYEGYNRSNSTNDYNNYNDINALRSELTRLRNQVNESARADTVFQKVSELNTGVNDSLYMKQGPGDTSQLSLLRREIEQLRAEMTSLQNTRPAIIQEKRNEPAVTFDPSLFPVISVYFKTGSVVVGDDQLERIMPFVQVAVKNPDIPIVLRGFTDPVGNAASNRVLARKRTAYIKSLLVTRFNIASNRITINEPALQGSSKGGKANPLDRRVDLKFN